MPTPDAQSARYPSQHSSFNPSTHSMPDPSSFFTPQAVKPSAPMLQTGFFEASSRDGERVIDFAAHSWDLATGGLKTLTAKRELPYPPDRRPLEKLPLSAVSAATPRSDLFALVILACVVLMLVSGGVVLFMMIAP